MSITKLISFKRKKAFNCRASDESGGNLTISTPKGCTQDLIRSVNIRASELCSAMRYSISFDRTSVKALALNLRQD